jgi:hypothetical protein
VLLDLLTVDSPNTRTYAGVVACQSSVAARVSKTKASAGAFIPAQSVVVAHYSKTKVPAGTSINALSVITAHWSKTKVPAGTKFAAQSTIAGDWSKTKAFHDDIAAHSTIAGDWSRTKAFHDSIAAQSTIAGDWSKTKAFSGNIAAQATIASTYLFAPVGAHTFIYAGRIAAQSTIVATYSFASTRVEIDKSGGFRSYPRRVEAITFAMSAHATMGSARVSIGATSHVEPFTAHTATNARVSISNAGATATSPAFATLNVSFARARTIAGALSHALPIRAAVGFADAHGAQSAATARAARLNARSSLRFANVEIGPDAIQTEFDELLLLMEMDVI